MSMPTAPAPPTPATSTSLQAASKAASVRQLSAADDLIRMWGTNTVKSGPGRADKTQAVRVDATGGTFTLGFEANTTPDIAADATAAQLESALDGLASIGAGGVSVTGGPGDAGGTAPYIVTFDGGSFAGADQPQLRASQRQRPAERRRGLRSALTPRTPVAAALRSASRQTAMNAATRAQGPRAALPSIRQMAMSTSPTTTQSKSTRQPGSSSEPGAGMSLPSGPDDSSVNEQKSVTVKASGGTSPSATVKRQRDRWKAPRGFPTTRTAAAVESALDNLAEIGGAGELGHGHRWAGRPDRLQSVPDHVPRPARRRQPGSGAPPKNRRSWSPTQTA